MPAAEMTRLRMQINQLILIFAQPVEFRRRLHDLFNLYANHAYRAGQAVKAQPLVISYRVPPLVMRQLETELSKICQAQPRQALALVDQLWEDEYMEPRLLAAALLGSIPVESAGGEVLERLRAWCRPELNLAIFAVLAEAGTARLRREAIEPLIALIEEWLADINVEQQAVGLRALLPFVKDRSFENLPVIFRMLSPLLQAAAQPLHADLLALLHESARRAPVETAYYLRQVLSLASGNATARLVRRILAEFPPAQQATLRAAMQAKSAFP